MASYNMRFCRSLSTVSSISYTKDGHGNERVIRAPFMSAAEIRQPPLVVVEHALEGDPLARVWELRSGTGIVDVLIDSADNTISNVAAVLVPCTIAECVLVGNLGIFTVMLGWHRCRQIDGEEQVGLGLLAFDHFGIWSETY